MTTGPCTDTPYCTGHDTKGECVLAEHIIWCDPQTCGHDSYGDCMRTWKGEDWEVEVTSSLDGATYLSVNCGNMFETEPLEEMLAAIARAKALMIADIAHREINGW